MNMNITMREFWNAICKGCFNSNVTAFSNKIGIPEDRLNSLIQGDEEVTDADLKKMTTLIGGTDSDIKYWVSSEKNKQLMASKRVLFALFVNSIKKKLEDE